jgi:hypothetical protein
MAPAQKYAAVAAVAAAVFGVLLLGSPGSFAKLTASATGSSLAITSGTISASVTGPTTGTVTTAAAPAGVVVAAGSVGIIPGIQAQTLTYSITNSSSSASPAAISSIHVVGTSILDTTRWADIQPYLAVTVAVNGGTPIALPASTITSAGIDATVSTSGNVQPGTTVPVVISFSIPATASSGTIDLLRTLQADRSSGLAIASIIGVAPVFTLTQSSIAAP